MHEPILRTEHRSNIRRDPVLEVVRACLIMGCYVSEKRQRWR
jgi:hypothetical protein